jgi:hypothetical protein
MRSGLNVRFDSAAILRDGNSVRISLCGTHPTYLPTEASFTCAARPALTLVIAVKGNGFGECGHMLLFTMIPLEGQPLASKPAGRP